jgi:AcrR family transcriptional regulator
MQQAKSKTKRKPKKRAVKTRNLTIRQLVEGVGVSDTTLKKYFARGCPRTSIEAVQKWRSENIKAVAEDAEVSEIGIELKRAEMAERWENARTRQIKNDRLQNELRPISEIEHALRVIHSRVATRLMSLGHRCANVVPSELKAVIKQEVEETVRIAMKEAENEICSLL